MIKADVEGSRTLALLVDDVALSTDGDAVSGVLGVEAVLSVRLSLSAVMPLCGFFFLVISWEVRGNNKGSGLHTPMVGNFDGECNWIWSCQLPSIRA